MLPRTLSLAASVLACAAVMLVSAAPDADAARPACGAKILKPTGGSWRCTFADEFSGGQLDRSKWSVMTTAQSGFSHAWECYVDDPSTVSVANGSLSLTARKLDSAAPCGSLFQSPYQSGMVHTKSTFAQTYGRFEARVKFPAGGGLHGAWWMWPRDMAYGQQSGEIDVAEHWGTYPDIVSPYVHVNDDGGERGKGAYCNLSTAETGFHEYAVEWLPLDGFRFIYDGNVCMTLSSWDPGSPLTYPQPFDKPFFLNLTMALQYGAVNDSTPFPVTMSVDYVRAWS